MSGKFEIKAVVTGASQAADEVKKMGDAAQQSGDKIQKSGEQSEKAAGKKNALVDAFKKLKHEVPLVGAALDTFKNPIAAVTIGAAFAVTQFRQFSEQIEALQQIIGTGKLADQMNNIRTAMAGAAADANKFKAALAEITNRPESVTEGVARRSSDIERRLKVEAARDEMDKSAALAGVSDPEERAAIEAKFKARANQREQRKLGGEANNLAQAQYRAQDIVREGEAALPGAKKDLENAAIRRDQLLATANAQTVDIDALEKQIAANENGRLLGGVRDFLSPAGKKLRATRDAALLAGAKNNNANAAQLRVDALAEFDVAQKSFNDLQSRTLGAAEDVRKFSLQRGSAVADASAFQQFNDPGAAALLARSREVQAIFDDFLRRIALMTNDNQKRVDAIGRANAAQAQQ